MFSLSWWYAVHLSQLLLQNSYEIQAQMFLQHNNFRQASCSSWMLLVAEVLCIPLHCLCAVVIKVKRKRTITSFFLPPKIKRRGRHWDRARWSRCWESWREIVGSGGHHREWVRVTYVQSMRHSWYTCINKHSSLNLWCWKNIWLLPKQWNYSSNSVSRYVDLWLWSI